MKSESWCFEALLRKRLCAGRNLAKWDSFTGGWLFAEKDGGKYKLAFGMYSIKDITYDVIEPFDV